VRKRPAGTELFRQNAEPLGVARRGSRALPSLDGKRAVLRRESFALVLRQDFAAVQKGRRIAAGSQAAPVAKPWGLFL